jgi:hypothetical protein
LKERVDDSANENIKSSEEKENSKSYDMRIHVEALAQFFLHLVQEDVDGAAVGGDVRFSGGVNATAQQQKLPVHAWLAIYSTCLINESIVREQI